MHARQWMMPYSSSTSLNIHTQSFPCVWNRSAKSTMLGMVLPHRYERVCSTWFFFLRGILIKNDVLHVLPQSLLHNTGAQICHRRRAAQRTTYRRLRLQVALPRCSHFMDLICSQYGDIYEELLDSCLKAFRRTLHRASKLLREGTTSHLVA